MALITANYFLKWLSRLISIKRSDALTATLENDSASIFNVKVGQKRVQINNHITLYCHMFHYPFNLLIVLLTDGGKKNPKKDTRLILMSYITYNV